MNTIHTTIGKNPTTENVGDVLEVLGWSKTKEVIEKFGDEELSKVYEDVYLYGEFFEDDFVEYDDL